MDWNQAYKELKAGKCIRSEFWDDKIYIKIWCPMGDVDYHRILIRHAGEIEDIDNQWTPGVAEFDNEWELYEGPSDDCEAILAPLTAVQTSV